MVYSMPGLLEKCHLSVNGKKFEWEPGGPAKRRFSENGPDQKRHLLLSLQGYLMTLHNTERDEAMRRLWAWSGLNARTQPVCRALRAEELFNLAESGFIEVGAHSLAHPALPALPLKEQEQEIRGSKHALEGLLKREVKSFSYPHGLIAGETAGIVKRAGFTCACASFNDVVYRGSNCFYLPRFWASDWDGRRFSLWLRRWLTD
jgi:peptidoglycan/xylan/chitin deacetylase (PgdA/CDA1 family)